jgi:hypothetical protein
VTPRRGWKSMGEIVMGMKRIVGVMVAGMVLAGPSRFCAIVQH